MDRPTTIAGRMRAVAEWLDTVDKVFERTEIHGGAHDGAIAADLAGRSTEVQDDLRADAEVVEELIKALTTIADAHAPDTFAGARARRALAETEEHRDE